MSASQYQWVQLDSRDGYQVQLRASRLVAIPETPETVVSYVDHSSRVIYATDWNEVQKVTSDPNYIVQSGDLVVISNANGDMDMYVWADDTNTWKNVPLAPTIGDSASPMEMIVGNDADRANSTIKNGTLYFAQDTQKIYLYVDGKCVAFTSNNVSSEDIINSLDKIQETILLPAGETLVNLTEGFYIPGDENLDVMIDGIVQPVEAYVELNDHQFQFKAPIDEDVVVTVEYFAKK